MPFHRTSPSPDLGYHWSWTWGHLILTTIFAAAAASALVLGAPWWLWAPLVAFTLWALAGFVVMRFVIRMNEISNLPTVSFLPAGEGTVLDIGCGTGRISIAMARARPAVKVTGLDNFSADYIHDHGDSNTERNFRLAGISERAAVQSGDMREMPFEDGSFDAAASCAAIDHLEPADIPKTLSEVNRVLRPSGQFLLMVLVPNIWTLLAFGPLMHHGIGNRRYWRQTLADTGFTLDDEGTSGGIAWFLATSSAERPSLVQPGSGYARYGTKKAD